MGYVSLQEIVAFDYHDGATVGVGRQGTNGPWTYFRLLDWDDGQDLRVFEMSELDVDDGLDQALKGLSMSEGTVRWGTSEMRRAVEEKCSGSPGWLVIALHPDSVDHVIRPIPVPRPERWFEALGLDRHAVFEQ